MRPIGSRAAWTQHLFFARFAAEAAVVPPRGLFRRGAGSGVGGRVRDRVGSGEGRAIPRPSRFRRRATDPGARTTDSGAQGGSHAGVISASDGGPRVRTNRHHSSNAGAVSASEGGSDAGRFRRGGQLRRPGRFRHRGRFRITSLSIHRVRRLRRFRHRGRFRCERPSPPSSQFQRRGQVRHRGRFRCRGRFGHEGGSTAGTGSRAIAGSAAGIGSSAGRLQCEAGSITSTAAGTSSTSSAARQNPIHVEVPAPNIYTDWISRAKPQVAFLKIKFLLRFRR